MENTDTLLGGFAHGDGALDQHPENAMKRDQDSTDDFEHLEREGKQDAGESPLHHHRSVTQSFLDMERAPAPEPPRAPSVTDKLVDHIADKFTDSESDADTAGESPLHRPAPSAPTSEPPAIPAHDPTPVLAPIPAVSPALAPAPAATLAPVPAETPAPAPLPVVEPASSLTEKQQKPESKLIPVPAPEPEPEPEPEVKPKAVEREPVKLEARAPEPAVPTRAPIAHVIEAEVIFCQMGLDAWFDPQRLHPKVESLIYWRSAARSGAALGAGLALLVALACCSVVSVLAYASLLALSAAVAFRIYKNVLQAVQKTNDGHPFKWLLEKDISVSAERAQSVAAAATAHLNALLHELRSLFLVEDLVDSLKFGVMLWCGTYLGACFNGITLIILGWIALFTLPKAYEMNKEQVDANLQLARAKINDISAKVRAAVPLGRKADADKDK